MPRAEATVEIAAPLEIVWRAMTDLAAYAEWNPFIVRVEAPGGPPDVGTVMRFTVRWGRGGGARSVERVTTFEPPTEKRRAAAFAYRFTGPLDALGLVRGVRWQRLREESGRVRYHTEEEFTGLLTAFLPLKKVQDGFERHAEALRARSEHLAKTA
jgi:hypothetical protein